MSELEKQTALLKQICANTAKIAEDTNAIRSGIVDIYRMLEIKEETKIYG